MSYQTGALDLTLLNGEQVDQVKDDPEFTSVGAGYLWYISPNIDGVPELANENLRKAMTFALDRDAITGDVLKDGSAPCYTARSSAVRHRPRTAATSAPTRPSSLIPAHSMQPKQPSITRPPRASWARTASPSI